MVIWRINSAWKQRIYVESIPKARCLKSQIESLARKREEEFCLNVLFETEQTHARHSDQTQTQSFTSKTSLWHDSLRLPFSSHCGWWTSDTQIINTHGNTQSQQTDGVIWQRLEQACLVFLLQLFVFIVYLKHITLPNVKLSGKRRGAEKKQEICFCRLALLSYSSPSVVQAQLAAGMFSLSVTHCTSSICMFVLIWLVKTTGDLYLLPWIVAATWKTDEQLIPCVFIYTFSLWSRF